MVNNIHDSCLHWEVGEAMVIKTIRNGHFHWGGWNSGY